MAQIIVSRTRESHVFRECWLVSQSRWSTVVHKLSDICDSFDMCLSIQHVWMRIDIGRLQKPPHWQKARENVERKKIN